MASLLLSCLGLASSRFRDKRRAKAEREKEYTENFESLKEQNAKRVRQLSGHGSIDSTSGLVSDTHRTPSMQEESTGTLQLGLPKYDDIMASAQPVTHSV